MMLIKSAPMPRRLPPGCSEDVDRHGNVRVYFRARGRAKIRIRGTPWTAEFMEALNVAKDGPLPRRQSGIETGTWRWLCVKYFAECADFKRLDPRTQHVRRDILEATFDEPISPGSSKLFRDFPLSLMTPDAVEVRRDRKIKTPEAANGRVKAMRQVLKFGMKKKWPNGAPYIRTNPAREVPYFKTNSTGFHTWTLDEVRQFEEHHAIGTKARLALALLLFTGQRRSDVIRFGRQHVRNGKITFNVYKGRNRKPKRLTLPILATLQTIIDASPCGELTFLVNDWDALSRTAALETSSVNGVTKQV
jgi:integrase